jgi:hypothetical protein
LLRGRERQKGNADGGRPRKGSVSQPFSCPSSRSCDEGRRQLTVDAYRWVLAADLENKLRGAKKAIERANKTREDAAQEMVQDAKARLDMMKEEVSPCQSVLFRILRE